MYYKVSLIFLFALFIIIHSENVTNDPACTDEKNFGPNMFCMLAFTGYANKTFLLETYPDAEYCGVATIPKHRFDYVYSPMFQDNEPAIVPDECETAYAIAYLIPTKYFNDALEKATSSTGGCQYAHSVKTAAQVTIQQNTLNVYCNMFVSIYEAPKVKPLPLNRRPAECSLTSLVELYRESGLPENYINKVANIDTNPNLTC